MGSVVIGNTGSRTTNMKTRGFSLLWVVGLLLGWVAQAEAGFGPFFTPGYELGHVSRRHGGGYGLRYGQSYGYGHGHNHGYGHDGHRAYGYGHSYGFLHGLNSGYGGSYGHGFGHF